MLLPCRQLLPETVHLAVFGWPNVVFAGRVPPFQGRAFRRRINEHITSFEPLERMDPAYGIWSFRPAMAIKEKRETMAVAAVPARSEKTGNPKGSVVSSTCAILRVLAISKRPGGVNAIARELGLAPSSCFKILKQLEAQGFVTCDKLDKSYALGAAVIRLGRRALDPANVYSRVRPLLEQAAQQHSIAIGLWRVLPDRRIVLAGFIEDSTSMRINMTVGQRLPRLMGAAGRAIGAELRLPPAELREEFDAMRWHRPLSFEQYQAGVDFARRNGYAVDAGYFAPGVCSIATIIRDDEDDVRFGLSGIMFNGQHDEVTIARIGRGLIELADTAASQLGWRPAPPF